jgi:hypothetical protein
MKPCKFELGSDAKGRVLVDSFVVIQGSFALETCIGRCSGIFSLVPVAQGGWKALTIVIGLESIRGSPNSFAEGIAAGSTLTPRTRPGDPTVVIIGAGQAGLSVAARLESIGISTVIIERRERVGDSWRARYDSLNINTPKDFSE